MNVKDVAEEEDQGEEMKEEGKTEEESITREGRRTMCMHEARKWEKR